MAVCSILYQAAIRGPQQEKMAEEIARVFPDPCKPINYGDLDKLHYTKAFVREVFRYETIDEVERGKDMPFCLYCFSS